MSERARYDVLAPLYDAVDLAELMYKRRLRPRLLAGLTGRILDAGVGTGCNVPFYPPGAQVVGVDLSPGMLVRARGRAARLGRPVGLAAMDLLRTGFADAAFDAVVSAFTFCVIEDKLQQPALAELARVCRPGGEIRILDYALSRRPLVRLLMKAWEPWERAVWGGAFGRDTAGHLGPAGLALVREESFVGDMVRLLVARRPG